MAVTSAAVRTVSAGVHRHWLLGPIGTNANQCRIVARSSTTYRDGVQRQRSYIPSHCPTLQVCQIIVACCMLHNLALRRQVLFLQEDGPDGGVVAAVETVDSEDEEAEEEDIDNRTSVILQYFQ
ncbi:hypothetical protein NDU88_011047 [Pleurodeles waltl]|uniref:Nuclease HARBI1 n=1 Tax=Pleurodeles waltl TaxID=8319 RepID=A0AAV7QXP5_PLEWA|nr:hypothetical protein NDU88_011047 [Pleurodeles waltl]